MGVRMGSSNGEFEWGVRMGSSNGEFGWSSDPSELVGVRMKFVRTKSVCCDVKEHEKLYIVHNEPNKREREHRATRVFRKGRPVQEFRTHRTHREHRRHRSGSRDPHGQTNMWLYISYVGT